MPLLVTRFFLFLDVFVQIFSFFNLDRRRVAAQVRSDQISIFSSSHFSCLCFMSSRLAFYSLYCGAKMSTQLQEFLMKAALYNTVSPRGPLVWK